jgi:hypothetical protein
MSQMMLRSVSSLSIGAEVNTPFTYLAPGVWSASTVRTASTFDDDLALSSAYMPVPGSTLAVIYGCSEAQRTQIIQRVNSVELEDIHPTLLPGIIAELERVRLSRMVDRLLNGFELQAWRVGELDLDMSKAKMAESLKLSLESRAISIQMQAARRQWLKLGSETVRSEDFLSQRNKIPDATPEQRLREEQLRQAGQQIISRLDEIVTEFDDKISECNMIIDNMSLTMQTVSVPRVNPYLSCLTELR